MAKIAANMELVLCFARMRTRVSAAHCFVLQTTSQTRLVHFARIREHMFCCSLHNTKGIEDRQGSMTCLGPPRFTLSGSLEEHCMKIAITADAPNSYLVLVSFRNWRRSLPSHNSIG